MQKSRIKKSIALTTCSLFGVLILTGVLPTHNREVSAATVDYTQSERGNAPSSTLPVPPGYRCVPQPTGMQGNLKVINWAGFTGAVSYTFDDSNSSQLDNFPAINALGVPMSWYLLTSKTESASCIWKQAIKSGHEIGNHTDTHPEIASESDIDKCTAFIQHHFGITPLTIAAPYGDLSYVDPSKPRFLFNRGVWGGSIAPYDDTVDPYNLLCTTPETNATASDLTNIVNTARSAGNWQILLFHGFNGGTDTPYHPLDVDQFIANVKEVKAWGDMWMDSVINIGSYWLAQMLFSSLTPTISGRNIEYQWKLPAHFPSGKSLRVTVTGGTLKQNNKVLKWDSHGYYEISLDAGSLTITP